MEYAHLNLYDSNTCSKMIAPKDSGKHYFHLPLTVQTLEALVHLIHMLDSYIQDTLL